MLGMIFNLLGSWLEVCPAFLRSVLPFVLLVVSLRLGYWLRKQYLKGLRSK